MLTCRSLLVCLAACAPLSCCTDGGGGWGNYCVAGNEANASQTEATQTTPSTDSDTSGDPVTSMDMSESETDTLMTSGTTTTPSVCGNMVVEPGEECDDGNSDNSDDCVKGCKAASCGDNFVQVGKEECDEGADNDDSGECLSTCVIARCGDGHVLSGKEECDDGNSVQEDSCTNDCKLPACGDGFVQRGEECDDGAKNVFKENAKPNECTKGECRYACGDGTKSSQEACDDGNVIGADGCSPQCEDEFVMFVTSATFSGAFGGIAGADGKCETAAKSANLTGTYVAWLSVKGNDAKNDLPTGKKLIRRDGAVIVASAESLIAGQNTDLLNPVNVGESGLVASGYAWTGTRPDGTSADFDCTGWVVGTNQGLGTAGRLESKTSNWTLATDVPPANVLCNAQNHIYCFRKGM